ncbi:MAG: hypothetical protein NTX65_12170 [Ignavibacteriales bacterium]|nr:hypothetical protein [Ignavibacteriales bacterium]
MDIKKIKKSSKQPNAGTIETLEHAHINTRAVDQIISSYVNPHAGLKYAMATLIQIVEDSKNFEGEIVVLLKETNAMLANNKRRFSDDEHRYWKERIENALIIISDLPNKVNLTIQGIKGVL